MELVSKYVQKNGFVDFVNHSAHLLDDVVIDMTNGYIMFSEEIRFDHKLGNLSIPGSVYASGPSGRIIAGSMELLNYNNMNNTSKEWKFEVFLMVLGCYTYLQQ